MRPPPELANLRSVTPTLGALVEHYRRTVPEGDFNAFIELLRNLSQGYAAELSACPPGAERARALHRLVEKELLSLGGATPTCARGCTACCDVEVEIVRDEADLLAQRIGGGVPVDRALLARQASRERQSPEWSNAPAAERRCAFLSENGDCRVYEDRPAVCRKHLMASPPAECARPGGALQPITVPLAELILSTAVSLPDNPWAPLPKGVHAALAPEG